MEIRYKLDERSAQERGRWRKWDDVRTRRSEEKIDLRFYDVSVAGKNKENNNVTLRDMMLERKPATKKKTQTLTQNER